MGCPLICQWFRLARTHFAMQESQMTETTAQTGTATGFTVDPAEVEKFSRIAAEWWDTTGNFAPLHKLNPVRLGFIRDEVCARFGRDPKARRALEGLSLLDIGCGGGLLSEPMARMGAEVTAVDASEPNIKTASVHASEGGLHINFRHGTAEDLVGEGRSFDVVLNMEVVEHVADVPAFLEAAANLVAPGGIMILATLNRTAKAFALAVVGAEYVLGWVPKGTHDHRKFVTPGEVRDALTPHGMNVQQPVGVAFNPLMEGWKLSKDTDVNYMIVGKKG